MLSDNSIRSATDGKGTGIVEFHVTVHQPATGPPVHTVATCHTNLPSLSFRIAGIDIPACRTEVAAMEPQLKIAKVLCPECALTLRHVRSLSASSKTQHHMEICSKTRLLLASSRHISARPA